VADDFWREAVALKRYRSHPIMLIGDEPQSYPSYRDIAPRGSPRSNAARPGAHVSNRVVTRAKPDLTAYHLTIATIISTRSRTMLTPATLAKRISPTWSIIETDPLSERPAVCHVLFQTELQICATGFRHLLRQVEIGGLDARATSGDTEPCDEGAA
jgi:hypothetical protein